MIHYNLICAKGHEFDDWFDNSADFDKKAKQKKLKCPTCGNKKVSKAIMAPSVKAAAPEPACGAPSCENMGCPMSGRR